MPVCSHCGHALIDDPSFADQIGSAEKEFSHPKVGPERPADDRTLFDALTYLGRSREYNDMLAFHLLYQVFVAMSRHDRVEDWPSRDEMWREAEHKVLEEAMVAQ